MSPKFFDTLAVKTHRKNCDIIPPRKSAGTFTPKKKALLIGIDYTASRSTKFILQSPQGDAKKMKELLINQYSYPEDGVVIMTDALPSSHSLYPNKRNILRELTALLNGQKPGDHFVFYFSGHSSQQIAKIKDTVGRGRFDDEEYEGQDELIIPCGGYLTDGFILQDNVIVDRDLKRLLIGPLLPESHFTAIFDSCHSGTLLDLPHHRCNRVPTLNSLLRCSRRRAAEYFYKTRNEISPIQPIVPSTKTTMRKKPAHPAKIRPFCDGYCPHKISKQDILFISVTKDREQIFESDRGESMTTYLVNVLRENPNIPLKELIRPTRFQPQSRRMDKQRPALKIAAIPQLSSYAPLKMNSVFTL